MPQRNDRIWLDREQLLLGVVAVAKAPQLRSRPGDKHEQPAIIGSLVAFFCRLQVLEIGVGLGRHRFDFPSKDRDTNTPANYQQGYQQNGANDREGQTAVRS
jgi:hypothetical protein